MTTMVVGTAIGYGEAQMVPFVTSLRRTGYAGEIVLIVDPPAAAAIRRSPKLSGVRAYEVRTLRLNLRYRRGRHVHRVWLPLQFIEWLAVRVAGALPLQATRRRALQCAIAGRLFHPEMSRFVHYARIVEDSPADVAILTDVRDVTFQTDPFEALSGLELAAGMERAEYTNDTEYWNRRWILASYDDAMVARLAGCQVSCAGVVYGTRTQLVSYLEQMVGEVLGSTLDGFAQMADQAMHNVLVWTGRVGSPSLLQPLASPIATLNGFTLDELTLDEQGRLLNEDGSVVSIIHQHDRVDGLAERLSCSNRPGLLLGTG